MLRAAWGVASLPSRCWAPGALPIPGRLGQLRWVLPCPVSAVRWRLVVGTLVPQFTPLERGTVVGLPWRGGREGRCGDRCFCHVISCYHHEHSEHPLCFVLCSGEEIMIFRDVRSEPEGWAWTRGGFRRQRGQWWALGRRPRGQRLQPGPRKHSVFPREGVQVATLTHVVSGVRPLGSSPLYRPAVIFGKFLKTAALTLDSPRGPKALTWVWGGTLLRESRVHVSAPTDDMGRPAAPTLGPEPGLSHELRKVHCHCCTQNLVSGTVVTAGHQGDHLRMERA